MFAAVTVIGGAVSSVTGQTAPLEWEDIPVAIESGLAEAPVDAAPRPHVIFSEIVGSQHAEWVRLEFGEVEFAGSLRHGDNAFLRITSLHDGGQQILDAVSIQQWRNTSAYFNGRFVQVELLAHPETGPSSVEITSIQAGLPQQQDLIVSICGDEDERQLSNAPPNEPDGRIRPVGCTGFLIGEQCFLTAGHCTTNPPNQHGSPFDPDMMEVVEFNVPLSNADGSINFSDPDDQYPIDTDSIQFDSESCGEDWASFGAFPNSNTGLKPLEAQGTNYTLASAAPPADGQNIRIRGYGTTWQTELPNEWSQVLTWDDGPYVNLSGTLVQHQADTTGGNSGSAIYEFSTGTVIGVHACGGCGKDSGANNGTAIDHPNLQNALNNPQGVCAVEAACPGDGDCCEANGSVGCNDAECCELICAQDPFCCDVDWDGLCANAANDECPVCFECGHPQSGNCCEANGTPYCNDEACCELICKDDPFCCNVDWDGLCANAANEQCIDACFECGHEPAGDCCESNDTPYCEDAACCELVCDDDPFCCNTNWDGLCADVANEQCIDACFECGHEFASNCCESNGTPFCDDAECCELICNDDPFCCNTDWDGLCASAANNQCIDSCFECGHEPAGNCCESNGTPYCDDAQCCGQVCDADPFCCNTEWDGLCASAANDLCEHCIDDSCPWDLTGNGAVGTGDLLELLSEWGPCPDPADCPADFTGNGSVGTGDLIEILGNWGTCPSP